jgi:uncharacterized protein YcfL
MKSLIISIAITSLLFVACSSSTKENKNTTTFIKTLTEIKTVSPNIYNSSKMTYDDNNRIVEVKHSVNGFDDYKIECKYNKSNQISGLKTYYDNKLSICKHIEWFADSIRVTKYNVSDIDTTESSKEIYSYNSNKEITQIARYKKDSLSLWKEKGSKYEFEWNNGNITTVRCYVPEESTIEDTALIDNQNLFELKELTGDFIKKGYKLYFESKYTYDNKNNPYNNTSISAVIIPNKFNISKNNPLKVEKKYVDGEVIVFSFKYKYNDKGYPDFADVDVTSNIEGFEKLHYSREFKY